MIGYLDIPDSTARPAMNDEGVWQCPENPVLEEALNYLFGIQDCSPADGRPGFRQIHQAAKHFDARPVITAPDDPEPEGANLVY